MLLVRVKYVKLLGRHIVGWYSVPVVQLSESGPDYWRYVWNIGTRSMGRELRSIPISTTLAVPDKVALRYAFWCLYAGFDCE